MAEYAKEEKYAEHLEKKVSEITTNAEKALRDLIDYGDELTMQDTILKEVHDSIEGDQNEDLAADPEVLSAVELFKQAKEDYAAKYASKSMRQRCYIPHFDVSIEANS
jgi:hypothetical protein